MEEKRAVLIKHALDGLGNIGADLKPDTTTEDKETEVECLLRQEEEVEQDREKIKIPEEFVDFRAR